MIGFKQIEFFDHTGNRVGRAGRDRLEAEEFDDGPPSEPHQPDDDASELPRDDPSAAAAGASAFARRATRCKSTVSGRRDRAWGADCERSHDCHGPLRSRSRGHRDRLLLIRQIVSAICAGRRQSIDQLEAEFQHARRTSACHGSIGPGRFTSSIKSRRRIDAGE